MEKITFTTDPQPMYNLTVDEAHTFFVGDGEWLVHNKCKGLVDNNILDEAAKGNQVAIDFLNANRGNLGAGPNARLEFTASATGRTNADFDKLLSAFDIEFVTPHYPAVTGDAANLQNLVKNAQGDRQLTPKDALNLAEAETLGVPVYTNDERFAKRILDLGGDVEFVDLFPGSGGSPSRAAQNLANYPQVLANQPKLR